MTTRAARRWIAPTLALVVALLLSPVAAHAQAAGSADPERMAAARDLMDATGVNRQLDDMMNIMVQGFSRGAGQSQNGQMATNAFEQMMTKFLAYKQPMLDDFAALYADRFTAAEMRDITTFYRSGAGARFITLMPELMRSGGEIGMKYAQKVQADVTQGR
jgi:hypothetical protein